MGSSSRTRDEALRTSRLKARETVEIEPSDDINSISKILFSPLISSLVLKADFSQSLDFL